MLQPKDTDWLNGYKIKTHVCAVYKKSTSKKKKKKKEIHFRSKDTYRLKVRGWKSIFHSNGKQKKLE